MPASRGMSGGSGMGRLDGEGVPASHGISNGSGMGRLDGECLHRVA